MYLSQERENYSDEVNLIWSALNPDIESIHKYRGGSEKTTTCNAIAPLFYTVIRSIL